jgi:hypothetical protein
MKLCSVVYRLFLFEGIGERHVMYGVKADMVPVSYPSLCNDLNLTFNKVKHLKF